MVKTLFWCNRLIILSKQRVLKSHNEHMRSNKLSFNLILSFNRMELVDL